MKRKANLYVKSYVCIMLLILLIFNVSSNIVYAAFSLTITYYPNGGEGDYYISSGSNMSTIDECTFTREGYYFLYWNTEADNSGTSCDPGDHAGNLVSGDDGGYYYYRNLYAIWGYTIEFNSNGGEGEMDSIIGICDEEITLSANEFTYNDYYFTGWNTEADGTGTSYLDEETVSNLPTDSDGTVVLYAQWSDYKKTDDLSIDDEDDDYQKNYQETTDDEGNYLIKKAE